MAAQSVLVFGILAFIAALLLLVECGSAGTCLKPAEVGPGRRFKLSKIVLCLRGALPTLLQQRVLLGVGLATQGVTSG